MAVSGSHPGIEDDPTVSPQVTDEGQIATLVLEGELADGYALKAPIRVEIRREGDEVVVDAADFNVHAFGANADEALSNLALRLVEHLRRLEELGERLAPRMQRDRVRLREAIVPPRG